jgi:uncharacterized protein YdeI (YjbR/CyaY-like superfamily)
MGKANPKADFYFNDSEKWQKEMKKLRAIALGCGLAEELKWGCPSYTLGKSNLVLIHEFKEYCAYLFFKGALLKDPKGILIQQTRNVQAARQIRFTNVKEITGMEATLKAYIKQAIEVEKSGVKVEMKKTEDFGMPAEFKAKLEDVPGLKKAFSALTPGRQRAYLLYFSSAKQSKTREARIEKNLDRILDGIGLDD